MFINPSNQTVFPSSPRSAFFVALFGNSVELDSSDIASGTSGSYHMNVSGSHMLYHSAAVCKYFPDLELSFSDSNRLREQKMGLGLETGT